METVYGLFLIALLFLIFMIRFFIVVERLENLDLSEDSLSAAFSKFTGRFIELGFMFVTYVLVALFILGRIMLPGYKIVLVFVTILIIVSFVYFLVYKAVQKLK